MYTAATTRRRLAVFQKKTHHHLPCLLMRFSRPLPLPSPHLIASPRIQSKPISSGDSLASERTPRPLGQEKPGAHIRRWPSGLLRVSELYGRPPFVLLNGFQPKNDERIRENDRFIYLYIYIRIVYICVTHIYTRIKR